MKLGKEKKDFFEFRTALLILLLLRNDTYVHTLKKPPY